MRKSFVYRLWWTVACLLWLWGSAPCVWAVQATLVADAHVSSAQPTVNAGSLSNLNVGNGYTTLIQFDLGVLPAGISASQVTRATLRIFCNRADTPGPIALSAVYGAWTESGVTYSNLPPLGTTLNTVNVQTVGAFVTLDVTSLVQGWVGAPGSNFGVALGSTGAAVQFDSKENDETSHLPQLEIVLASAGTGTSGGGTGAAGAAGVAGAAGATGATGATGVAGPAGPVGATGAVGPAGATGAAGAGLLNYKGTYSSGTNYANGDVVTFGGSTYISQTDSNHGNTPGFSPLWGLLASVGAQGPTGLLGATGATGQQGPPGYGIQGATGATGAAGATGAVGPPGMIYQGSYNSVQNYNAGDVVLWSGASYVSLLGNNHGNTPGMVPNTWGMLTAQGPTGFTGVSGVAGPTGPMGAPGSVGPPGERGDQGAQGVAGTAGAQGIPGVTGTTGLQGPMGATGPAGPVGLSFQGSYSAGTNYSLGQGVFWQGAGWVSLLNNNHGNTPDQSPSAWAMFAAPGTTGATGATGIGLTGATGATGAAGVTGATGTAGATGSTGAAGVNFTGAYAPATGYNTGDGVSYAGSSYVSLTGNNHGEAPDQYPNAWQLLAAQGMQGPAGVAGAAGATGATGSAGASGVAGPQGPPVSFSGPWAVGTTYATGAAVSYGGGSYIALSGNTGREPDSSPSYWGVLSAPGTPGASGATGATGMEGPAGYGGPQGATGATGATGAVGSQGVAGPAGATGPAGPVGFTGATGATGLVFQGAYNPAASYGTGAAVSYNGSTYISVNANNQGQVPGTSPNFWQLLAQAGAQGPVGNTGATGSAGAAGLQGATGSTGAPGNTGPAGAPGINWRAAWANNASYAVNDAVSFGGSAYLAQSSNRAQEPDQNPQVWAVLAQAGGAGAAGSQGATGSAATVVVGTVTTLPAGSQATVNNSGSASAAVLNFGIPQGAAGSAGAGGGGASGGGGAMVTAMYHPVSYMTTYYSLNNPNASASEGDSVLSFVPRSCSVSRLDVFSHQSAMVTVTLRMGTPGSMSGTSFSCAASSGNACSITGALNVAAGTFLDLTITGASGNSAGVWTAVECDLP